MAILPELVKVFIVEDEDLVRDTLSQSLQLIDNFQIVGASANISSSLDTIQSAMPDVCIVDVRLQNENGIEASNTKKTFTRFKNNCFIGIL